MEPIVVVELVSLKWMVGVIMFPGGSALIAILWLLRVIRNEQTSQHADIVQLLKMHRFPDEYGFGTGTTNEMIASIERTQKALIHYIKWGVEKMTGEQPPPPVE